MCELLGMSANTPTDLCFSFTGLTRRGGGTGPHKDGWGVAFYEGWKTPGNNNALFADVEDWVVLCGKNVSIHLNPHSSCRCSDLRVRARADHRRWCLAAAADDDNNRIQRKRGREPGGDWRHRAQHSWRRWRCRDRGERLGRGGDHHMGSALERIRDGGGASVPG